MNDRLIDSLQIAGGCAAALTAIGGIVFGCVFTSHISQDRYKSDRIHDDKVKTACIEHDKQWIVGNCIAVPGAK